MFTNETSCKVLLNDSLGNIIFYWIKVSDCIFFLNTETHLNTFLNLHKQTNKNIEIMYL